MSDIGIMDIEEFNKSEDLEKRSEMSVSGFWRGDEDRDRRELKEESRKRIWLEIKGRDEWRRDMEDKRVLKLLDKYRKRNDEKLLKMWKRENIKLLKKCKEKGIRVYVDYEKYIGFRVIFKRNGKEIRIKWIRSKKKRRVMIGKRKARVKDESVVSKMWRDMLKYREFMWRHRGIRVFCRISSLSDKMRSDIRYSVRKVEELYLEASRNIF